MFDCYIDFYIFNFDMVYKTLNIVSLSNTTFVVPSCKLNNTDAVSVNGAINEIISDHLVCSGTQIKPRLFDVSIEQTTIRVGYIATSPIDLKLIDAYYLNVESISTQHKNIRKALLYV